MLVHIDTSVLVEAFTGRRVLLPRVRTASAKGDVLTFSSLVLYEWLRGPRTNDERSAVETFFQRDIQPAFGKREAERAADLFRRVTRGRQRHADIAIAACAIEHGASLWTLNRADFSDIPGLTLFSA